MGPSTAPVPSEALRPIRLKKDGLNFPPVLQDLRDRMFLKLRNFKSSIKKIKERAISTPGFMV
jgi:hypothetical protein